MTRRKLFNFTIDEDLVAEMKQVQLRDGVSQAEQARRAIREWLEKNRVIQTDRPRVSPRKRT